MSKNKQSVENERVDLGPAFLVGVKKQKKDTHGWSFPKRFAGILTDECQMIMNETHEMSFGNSGLVARLKLGKIILDELAAHYQYIYSRKRNEFKMTAQLRKKISKQGNEAQKILRNKESIYQAIDAKRERIEAGLPSKRTFTESCNDMHKKLAEIKKIKKQNKSEV